MRQLWRVLLPIMILLAAGAGAYWLSSMRTRPERSPVPPWVPVVDVVHVTIGSQRLDVLTHGEIVPRAVATLSAEVTGRVIRVAPSAEAGVYVAADTPLITIDDADYRAALAAAEADLADAQRALAVEEAAAVRAASEWALVGDGEASPLTLRQPQVAAATARVAALTASVERAARDLERTTIAAPFAGRVVQRHVTVGDRVSPGAMLIEVEAADAVEVVLPIPLEDVAWLDLPLRGEQLAYGDGPVVELTTSVANQSVAWQGHVVRVRGQLDTRSRMVEVVAQIPQAAPGDSRPPLLTGLFVAARIHGREQANVVSVPATALQPGDVLWAYHAGQPPSIEDDSESSDGAAEGAGSTAESQPTRQASHFAVEQTAPEEEREPIADGYVSPLPATILRRDTDLITISVPDHSGTVSLVSVAVPGGEDGQIVRVRSQVSLDVYGQPIEDSAADAMSQPSADVAADDQTGSTDSSEPAVSP